MFLYKISIRFVVGCHGYVSNDSLSHVVTKEAYVVAHERIVQKRPTFCPSLLLFSGLHIMYCIAFGGLTGSTGLCDCVSSNMDLASYWFHQRDQGGVVVDCSIVVFGKGVHNAIEMGSE